MAVFEDPGVSREWEGRKAGGDERAIDRDRDSPWVIGALLMLAIAAGAFGIWAWALILSGPAR